MAFAVALYQSADHGVTWNPQGANLGSLASFTTLNSTPNSITPSLYYAPQLAASGFTNGLWAVAIPINYNGYNNVYLCTSNRGPGGWTGVWGGECLR
jgi:hypothetical protein